MLSRIGENLYWLGRYVERAENTSRLLEVNYHALIEAPLTPGAPDIVTEQWAPLLFSTDTEATFRQHFERADAASVPHWLTVHPDNVGSVRSSLGFARENARALRDRISLEMWECLNRAYLELCVDTIEPPEEGSLHDYCVAVRETSHLFFGIADATLPRDLGWYYLRAGQYLERADATLRTLMVRYRQYRGDEPVADGVAAHRGMALLRSLSAFEAFRKRHQTALEPERIAAFLLLDPDFPRSVRFCARVLDSILRDLVVANPGTSLEARRQAGWLAARLDFMLSAEQITERGDPSLEELLVTLAELSDAIGSAYFGRGELAMQQSQQQS